QPFYRALGTNVDGSGLGLPIVLEIARQHNAEIKLEDAHPGRVPPGTRVSVRFVLSDEAVASYAAAVAQAPL
ncbi:MAG TPA: sensor histidine kinase, partial [Ramlibacter sp.]|nr:sensor histidine kinase [Ramlibacter sp.]